MAGKSCYMPLLQSLKTTLAYRNFAVMTIGYLIMQAGFAFFNGALLFYVDTLLGLNESFATIVLAISIVVGICTYPLVNKLVRRVGKKPLLLAACVSYVFIYLGIYFHAPIARAISTEPIAPGFLASLAGEGAMAGDVAAAILIGVCVAFPIACTNILPPSAFADMAGGRDGHCIVHHVPWLYRQLPHGARRAHDGADCGRVPCLRHRRVCVLQR